MNILIVLFALINVLFAQGFDETMYVWKVDPEKEMRGNCYEVDKPTMGEKYLVKVSNNKCRPKKVSPYWVPIQEKFTGRCYLVDSETGGQKWSKFTSKKDCIPKTASSRWIEDENGQGHCFIVDENQGFVLKVSKKDCRTAETEFIWIPKETKWGGHCYEVAKGDSSFKRKVSSDKCRPAEVNLKWIPDARGIGGTCLEIHPNGMQAFSSRIDSPKCFSGSTSFKWDSSQNRCLKVGTSSDGTPMILKSLAQNCAFDENEFKFFREGSFKGSCFQIDSATKGERFKTLVSKAKCRPPKTVFQLINNGQKDACFELDPSDQVRGYISMVMDKFCHSEGSPARWEADPSGWGGKCLKEMKVGIKVFQKKLKDDACLPKTTKYIWHNLEKLKGNCYIIDAKKGPVAYSSVTKLKFCIPENMVYIYHKKKGQVGQCYQVDEKTKGEKFNRPALNKFCKDQVLWNPDKD